jgi:hypothetical protein
MNTTKARHKWTPLQRGSFDAAPPSEELIGIAMQKLGCDRQEAIAAIEKQNSGEVWRNDIYQVMVYRWSEDWWQLNIRRRDGGPILRDWRHFQRIKNEIVGEEHEAVELYPAESRLVDTANKFHLFVHSDMKFRFPFGWNEREVSYESGASPGTRQRPL